MPIYFANLIVGLEVGPDIAPSEVIRFLRPHGGTIVLADKRGLRTVLSNLIQNAIAFSPEGGQVRIRTAQDGAFVEIVIEDDGEGVDPTDLPRLMTPFEQGENALIRRGEGAGLGLPIAALTCQAMGGRLRLSCHPGAGLTARVRLAAA